MKSKNVKESAEIIILLKNLVKSDRYVHDPDRRVALFFIPPNSEWRDYWSKTLEQESYSFVPLTYHGSETKVGLRLISEGVVEATY
jgi:hypothetical protein